MWKNIRTTNLSTPGANVSKNYDGPLCPVCGGQMYDVRETKRNPKAPDYRCRTVACKGVRWPARQAERAADALVEAFKSKGLLR